MTVKIVLIWLSQNKKARTPSRMTDGGEVSDQSIIKKIYSAVSEGVSPTDIGGDSQSVSQSGSAVPLILSLVLVRSFGLGWKVEAELIILV